MNKDNSQIDRLHTSCKDCIFAHYNKKEQIGCDMGRLETYRSNNLYKTRHINPNIRISNVYDNQQEFFVINGMKCHHKRNVSWSKKVKKNKWKERVYEENRIKYQAIIFATNEMSDIMTTVESLLSQDIPPQHITAVRKLGNSIYPITISKYLHDLGIPWSLSNIVDSTLSPLDIVDSVLSARAYPYYSVFNAGIVVPQNLFTSVNEQIYEHNLRFAVLAINDLPIITSTFIHRAYGGNKPSSLLTKLRNDKCQDFIMDIREICQNYPNPQ